MTLRGPVLVGTDLSPAADEALSQGARLATELASKLFVCHVVPELIPDGSVFAEFRRANVDVEDSLIAKARAAVEQQVNTVRVPLLRPSRSSSNSARCMLAC